MAPNPKHTIQAGPRAGSPRGVLGNYTKSHEATLTNADLKRSQLVRFELAVTFVQVTEITRLKKSCTFQNCTQIPPVKLSEILTSHREHQTFSWHTDDQLTHFEDGKASLMRELNSPML